MLTPYEKQIEAVRQARTFIASLLKLTKEIPVEILPEVDQALNDAGASIVAMKRYEEMDEIPNKRAIGIIEKLIDRLNKAGDSSEVKDEAINYVVSFKR